VTDGVSIVIPARDAGATLARTLATVDAQQFTRWEVIVVDDGSRDDTRAVAESFAARDPRYRVLAGEARGAGVARNAGVAVARYPMLLFLDADDVLDPRHLLELHRALSAKPECGVAYCGWAYVMPDGEWVFPESPARGGDLFELQAQYCVSVIHTHLVRRSLFESMGGFDPALRTCDDWDLWQRISRTGAGFVPVPAVLAGYVARADSESRDGRQLLSDGLRVIERGHAPDERVPIRHPRYPDGVPTTHLQRCRYELLCACAGYEIGGRRNAAALLDLIPRVACPELDAADVGQCVFRHLIVSRPRPRDQWLDVYRECAASQLEFLQRLELHSGVERLAKRAHLHAARLALSHARPCGFDGRIRSIGASLVLGAQRRTRTLRAHARGGVHGAKTAVRAIPGVRASARALRRLMRGKRP
jgi:hypothetical protein